MSGGEVVAFVFARGGSKGVPRKNLRLLGGRPLVAHSVEAALASQSIDRVIVSTDDNEIAEAARRAGAEVPFLRPAHLAQDHSPELLSWHHALEFVTSEAGRMPAIFVSVPATSPFRSPADLDAAVELLRSASCDLVITVTEPKHNPYFTIIALDFDGTASLFARPPQSVYSRQSAPPVYGMTAVAFVARPEFVKSATSLFEGRVRALFVPPLRALDIDTELDLEFAEFLFARPRDSSSSEPARPLGRVQVHSDEKS